jgi:hypothetical protein
MPKRIAEHRERTARGFLAALSPLDGLLTGVDDAADFIFRGHGSERYGLIPSVFRGRGAPFPGNPAGRRERRTYEAQISAEAEQVAEFCRLADARGLRLAEDTQQLRSMLDGLWRLVERVAEGELFWPPDEMLSALALAQHYGVPTRLLDWSRHPYVAAYFAAADAVDHRIEGRLAVWAFGTSMVNAEIDDWLDDAIRIVTAPAAEIPNLYAQQGVFMLSRQRKFRKSAQFKGAPYEQVLERQLFDYSDRPLLYKFTLPGEKAPELLRLLASAGFDASTLFPGYAGVARAILERRRWPDAARETERFAQSVRRRFRKSFARWRR